MARRRALCIVLTAAFLALAPAAGATPVCTGQDRSSCGGRIIPEPAQSLGFLTYAEWTSAMQQLQKEHPDRVRFRQVGKSAGGAPLYDVTVTDFSDPTPLSDRAGIYLNGDIHGDERDGTEGFARAIEDLATSKSAGVVAQLRRDVLVFTDANPDGWRSGDVPPGGGQYTRENAATHDLNREWPVVGFQNPDTNPVVDPEVRGLVAADGNGLHRHDGIRFAYALDVHGSATPETPPNAQLMLDLLLSAEQHDLTRSLLQTQMADSYLKDLSATTSDNTLATFAGATGQQVYRVGEWDTSWDIYGYLVSGGFADWMGNDVTGLGAVSATVELFINGEPGQENTFAGYNQQVEAANVHSMRVAVQTLMTLAARPQHGVLHLPGPVAYVPNRFALSQADPKAVGDPATNPPGKPYPASTNRFFEDLGAAADRPLTVADPAALAGQSAVVDAQDPHLDDPALLAAMKRYVEGGGTLVLTDAGLRALAGMGLLPDSAIAMSKQYAGYFDVTDAASPLVKGARPLSRQTYEPVPIGYAITNSFNSATSETTSPVWTVDQTAWQSAGGTTAGTTGSGRTSLGELPLGKGRIRILGALLPDPTAQFAHPFGVADYALTYWGYQVLANMLNATQSLEAGPAPVAAGGAAPAGGPPPVGCVARSGFARVRVRPRGAGLRFDVSRRAAAPFSVEVLRVARGARIARPRRVARFGSRTRSFTWTPRGLAAGTYVARVAMSVPGAPRDVRRFALRRSAGRFATAPAFALPPRCSLLRSFSLSRPVFGGASAVPLSVGYRLTGPARVTVRLLRGRRAVRTLVRARARRAGRTYRLRVASPRLARGIWRVRVTVRRGRLRESATLASRRL